ncbi:DoxX family protein [Sulfurimonas autotrophica]|uniref:DoxX family protein n=1 Tax=Sulfurimonas autotrophica (strain ATCC BAA-671 / DSM 16294 / JCM 11897 / OK10) TaxID=563040 RepID=E0UPA6_SULAO|nr:DoxX family protein [Sulfurimonas autotrophica]ADN08570.1 DoxX family protein [Sulfurimonas autotrophica DSM 16294]
MFINPDIAKLLLRVSLGVLILFHGIHKVIHGIGGVKSMVVSAGLPEFFAYGVYVGELIAPIFIILGLYARVASTVLALNMFVAIYLAYGFSLTLSKFGGLAWETPLFYFIMSLLVVLLGSGKYAVNSK